MTSECGSSKETLLRELADLDGSALREVQARVVLLLKTSEPGPVEDREGEVYSLLCETLGEHGHYGLPPFAVLRKAPHYAKFRDTVPKLIKYMRDNLKPVNRVEERKALLLLMRILARWMVQAEIPVSAKTAIQQLGKVPSLIDRQFPGYRTAGLLPVVLRSR